MRSGLTITPPGKTTARPRSGGGGGGGGALPAAMAGAVSPRNAHAANKTANRMTLICPLFMSVFLGAKGVMRPSQLQRRAAMARYRIEGFSVFGFHFQNAIFTAPSFMVSPGAIMRPCLDLFWGAGAHRPCRAFPAASRPGVTESSHSRQRLFFQRQGRSSAGGGGGAVASGGTRPGRSDAALRPTRLDGQSAGGAGAGAIAVRRNLA